MGTLASWLRWDELGLWGWSQLMALAMAPAEGRAPRRPKRLQTGRKDTGMQWKQTLPQALLRWFQSCWPIFSFRRRVWLHKQICRVSGAACFKWDQAWKMKGKNFLWGHMEMTKVTPLGPQAASTCPAGREQPCVIKHSSLGPFWLGRRHKGRTQQGLFLFSGCVPLLTFTPQSLLGCYCVWEKETDPVLYGGGWLACPYFCCPQRCNGSYFMFTAPWHFLKGVFKAESPLLKTGFWAVKLTEFNIGKVNLIEKERRINNSGSIPKGLRWEKALFMEM